MDLIERQLKVELIQRASCMIALQLLTREGRVFSTLYETQDWMEGRGEEQYPSEQLQHLERLCLAMVEAYLATRNTTMSYKREVE